MQLTYGKCTGAGTFAIGRKWPGVEMLKYCVNSGSVQKHSQFCPTRKTTVTTNRNRESEALHFAFVEKDNKLIYKKKTTIRNTLHESEYKTVDKSHINQSGS